MVKTKSVKRQNHKIKNKKVRKSKKRRYNSLTYKKLQNGGGLFNWLKERLSIPSSNGKDIPSSNGKDVLKYMINKDINVKYKNKNDIVEFILKTFQNKIATEPDKNKLTSSNYIYWVTNNLSMMYMEPNDNTMDDTLYKFIDGPSYEIKAHNLKDGVERKEPTKDDVIKTQEHVRNILMKLPNKDLLALLGFSYLQM